MATGSGVASARNGGMPRTVLSRGVAISAPPMPKRPELRPTIQPIMSVMRKSCSTNTALKTGLLQGNSVYENSGNDEIHQFVGHIDLLPHRHAFHVLLYLRVVQCYALYCCFIGVERNYCTRTHLAVDLQYNLDIVLYEFGRIENGKGLSEGRTLVSQYRPQFFCDVRRKR